jgi:hypothetical protein
MNTYICNDTDTEIEIQATSPTEAAQQYVDGGDWGSSDETRWVNVRVVPVDENGEQLEEEGETITITIDPTEPACSEDEHDWQSPHEVVGGLEENPGVWGHGGGATITEVCPHCGAYRITDTWAQNPETGEQGLESVEYREADDASLAWVESLKEESENQEQE